MRAALLAALAVAVGACNTPGTDAPAPPADAESATVNPGPGLEAPADAAGGAAPDPASPQAAAERVLLYYGAIARGDYQTAYEMWGPDGPPDQTVEAFAAGYDETTNVRAFVEEPSEPEGAAGSTYITVPVVVTAQTASGADQRFEGDYVLRRVNDVPGAEPWQLRWHIESADLRETD